MFCTIGAHEWDDPDERNCSTNAFSESCAGHINRFDGWFTDIVSIDTGNTIYQNHRSVAHISMEVGSLAIGGYGLAKTGYKTAEFYALSRQAEKLGVNLSLNEIKFATRERLLGTLDAKIAELNSSNDVNVLSKAGQVLDRNGLTKAGRAIDKHGGRIGSGFPKAMGNPPSKNMQGQFHLDDILTHPQRKIIKDGNRGYEIYAPDGRGVYFRKDGTLRGFVEDYLR